jgi:hypothetical protein
MYQVTVYAITPNLWRWEIRCGGALRCCGTAPTMVAAKMDVNDVVNPAVVFVSQDADRSPPKRT